MDKICSNCNKEFETRRKDKLFCSDKCRKANSRNVTNTPDNVTDSSRSVTNSEVNVTDNSRNVTSNSVINEANTTKVPSAHRKNKQPDVTPKQEKREWLIQQFKDEGKQPDEINSIMQAQEVYYNQHNYYFIPARFNAKQTAAA